MQVARGIRVRNIAGWVLGLALVSPAATFAQVCDFSAADAALANLVSAVPGVPGAGLRIGTSDEVLHEAFFGTYDASTVVRTGSAAKVLSAAAVLSVVDDGFVGLDQPVSSVLPAFSGAKGTMTLRQMFSHTSGLPGGLTWSVLSDDTISLEEAADEIACCIALEADPFTQFSYGGLSMHVGGRMVEAASGALWDDLFATRIANPLGMTSTDYEGLGVTDNPRIAGGARTSLGDYALLLEMLLRGGVHDGERILSLTAVDEIFADQRMGLPGVVVPDGVGAGGYGLGVWRESFDAQANPIRVSDPGVYGLTPWIEIDRRVYGIIMIDWFRQPLIPALENIQGLVRAELDACNAQGPTPPVLPTAGRGALSVLALLVLSLGARHAGQTVLR